MDLLFLLSSIGLIIGLMISLTEIICFASKECKPGNKKIDVVLFLSGIVIILLSCKGILALQLQ